MTWVDFECTKCGAQKEVKFDSLKDITKTHPCECGEEMQRNYAPPAVKFIGAGFYVNDYGGKPPGSKN